MTGIIFRLLSLLLGSYQLVLHFMFPNLPLGFSRKIVTKRRLKFATTFIFEKLERTRFLSTWLRMLKSKEKMMRMKEIAKLIQWSVRQNFTYNQYIILLNHITLITRPMFSVVLKMRLSAEKAILIFKDRLKLIYF